MTVLWRYAVIAWSMLIMLPIQAQTVDRQQGLMGRSSLAQATGMLFDFPLGTRPAIWMRHMRMALDLLFVDEQAQLVQIFHEVPPCLQLPCVFYQADQPIRFVIELAPGSAQRLQLQLGDRLELGGHEHQPPPAS